MPKEQWKKSLEEIHVGRETSGVAWLETVSLKLPSDVIDMIDIVAENRSKFIRTAIMHELDRVLPEEETEDTVVDESEELLTQESDEFFDQESEETPEKESNHGDQTALF